MLNQMLDKENYTKNQKTFAEVLAKDKPLEKKIPKIDSQKNKE